ncbi:MAG: acyl--CoA ligase [Acidimicrobiia bacterium]|nr:acyl--CoA ligase [Acidimicrobiia bacterium]
MGMTFEEAVAVLTGPDAPFEIADAEVLGRPSRIFTKIPPALRDLFDLIRARPADDVYLVFEDERWTNGDMVKSIDEIATVLVERYGVTKGDRVAINMRNFPEWITAFGAATSIGAIAVLVNAWWTGPEIEFGLVDADAKVLITDRERVDRIGDRLQALNIHGLVVRAEGDLPPGCDHLADVVSPGATMPIVEIHPDDDATILFTSGTTGVPKGAVSTNRGVISGLFAFACRTTVEALRWAPDTPPDPSTAAPSIPACFILTVPLFHVTGCVPVMLGSVTTGARLVMMHKWDPLRALQLIEREKVTNFVGVPTMSQDLVSHPDFAKYDTSSLKNVGGGGAPMAPELVRKIEGSFAGKASPQLGYGLTETNGYGPGNTGPDYMAKPSSTGRVVPIMGVKIVDPNGSEQPNGEVGEVCLSGPMLIRGYWNRPEATAESIRDGWLHTGDLGYLDDQGFLYVVDRIKDMVLRGGENVYCSEVEAAIFEHKNIHEVAVFGLPHERLGEEVVAALLPTPGKTIDIDELTAFLAERIAPFKIPSQWFVRDEPLPRGATGKILKREIRDLVLEGKF